MSLKLERELKATNKKLDIVTRDLIAFKMEYQKEIKQLKEQFSGDVSKKVLEAISTTIQDGIEISKEELQKFTELKLLHKLEEEIDNQ